MIKHSKTVLLLVITLLTINVAFAQKKADKKKKKQVKKELKSYMKDTESYTKMMERYKEDARTCEAKVSELQSFNNTLKDDNSALNKQILDLNNQLSELTFKLEGASASARFSDVGTEYRVQIGAYKKFDITSLLGDNQAIGYKKVDGVFQYYIGAWENADDAFAFAKEFNKLKIDDAFVTKYVDGVRVKYDHLSK